MLERTLYKYRELGLFILRMAIGFIFVYHGYGKLFSGEGMTATVKAFTLMNIYFPQATAWLVALGEFIGGIFLLVGFLTRESALYLILIMFGAIYTVHGSNGFSLEHGGYEYNFALIGACFCLLFSGGGAGSMDKLLFPRERWTFISDPSKIRLEPPDNIID